MWTGSISETGTCSLLPQTRGSTHRTWVTVSKIHSGAFHTVCKVLSSAHSSTLRNFCLTEIHPRPGHLHSLPSLGTHSSRCRAISKAAPHTPGASGRYFRFCVGTHHLPQPWSSTLTSASCPLPSSRHLWHVFPDLRALPAFFLVPETQVRWALPPPPLEEGARARGSSSVVWVWGVCGAAADAAAPRIWSLSCQHEQSQTTSRREGQDFCDLQINPKGTPFVWLTPEDPVSESRRS